MKIMILSSNTPSLFWFRFDMMREFIRLGCEVIAVGPEQEIWWSNKFGEHSIKYKCIPVSRNGLNPVNDLNTLISLYKLVKSEKPDKIFTYQSKTVIYGSVAGKLNGISEIYSLIAGLGSIIRGQGIKIGFIRRILLFQYRIALRYNKKLFFQNKDDHDYFIKNGMADPENCVIINGSGVNLERFQPAGLPDRPGFLFVGRLLKDKGLIEYLEACRIIKSKYPGIQCMLVGPFDTNPTALRPKELESYIKDGTIEYFGEKEDVRSFIELCSVYVLPSYYEGTPKTVLEAMAMGRPVITTDAPGCRETVEEGRNGFLVQVKDKNALADKMEWFILHPEETEKMGQESLRICREKFDVKKVNADMMRHVFKT